MQKVIEEAVLCIPHLIVVHTDTINGIGDPSEVLKEAIGSLLINGVVISQNKSNLQHAQTVECHPSRAIGLIKMPARRKVSTAIEYPDVVQPEKATRKYIASFWVFSVDPPNKIQLQSLERAFQEAK